MPGCIVKESAVSSNLIRKFFFFIRVKAVCGSKAYLVDSSKLSRCVYIVAFYDASICKQDLKLESKDLIEFYHEEMQNFFLKFCIKNGGN